MARQAGTGADTGRQGWRQRRGRWKLRRRRRRGSHEAGTCICFVLAMVIAAMPTRCGMCVAAENTWAGGLSPLYLSGLGCGLLWVSGACSPAGWGGRLPHLASMWAVHPTRKPGALPARRRVLLPSPPDGTARGSGVPCAPIKWSRRLSLILHRHLLLSRPPSPTYAPSSPPHPLPSQLYPPLSNLTQPPPSPVSPHLSLPPQNLHSRRRSPLSTSPSRQPQLPTPIAPPSSV